MISNLKDINVKSFKHYSSNEEMSWANIIFGQNGSGKSSLAEWLAETESKARLFNTDYVNNNIFVDGSLGAIHLTVGEKAVNFEKNILTITEANKNIRSMIQTKSALIKHSNDQLYSEMTEKLSKAKEKFSMSQGIKQKGNAKDNPLKALKLWYSNIDTNLSEVSSSLELESKQQSLKDEISVLKIDFPFDEKQFKDFSNIMSESVQIPNEAVSNEISQWIMEGARLHDMNNKNQICQFCDNTFNGQVIEQIILEKTNSTHAKLIKNLEKVKSNLLCFEDTLETLPFPDVTEELLKFNEDIIDKIEQKIENTVKKISIGDTYLNLLNQLKARIQESKKIKNETLREIEKQLSRIELVAKSWIGQELKNDQSVQNLENDIKKNQTEIESLKLAQEDNEKWIDDKRREESDLKVFMDIANNELRKAGFGFELRIDTINGNYTVWHNKDDIQLEPSQLSEGERRFIAFIHFYYELFTEPGKKLASGVSMVIIDDPITSLDSDNRFYLTELINGLIKFAIGPEPKVQVFVLTHSSQDFHNFAYGLVKNTKWFRIVKDEQGLSSVEPVSQDEKKNYSDYYRTTFKSLISFAQLSKTKLNDSYLSYGNKARVIFESHAKSHYTLNYATSADYKKIKQFYEIPNEFDSDVKRMLDVINSMSHGLTIIDEIDISPKELQTNVRTLLQLLWLKDKQHVEQMAGEKINLQNRNDTMKWLSAFEK